MDFTISLPFADKIAIHRSSSDPSTPGELLVECIVVGIDASYDHPRIEVKFPAGFTPPQLLVDVMLYAGDRYFGNLILGPDGFSPHPDALHTSPYFKIEIVPSLLPPPIDDQIQAPRFGF